MKPRNYSGVLAFSDRHAIAIVFMALGFDEFDAVDLSFGDYAKGDL